MKTYFKVRTHTKNGKTVVTEFTNSIAEAHQLARFNMSYQNKDSYQTIWRVEESGDSESETKIAQYNSDGTKEVY